MINKLREELKKQLQSEFRYVSNLLLEDQLIALLVLKYKCDNNKCSYKEMIKEYKISEISYDFDSYNFTKRNVRSNLLALIQYEDIKDLVKEYLNERTTGIEIINNNEKKLCATSNLKKEVYDILGNTTYIIDKFNLTEFNISVFKFFDVVLENNNKYLKYDEIEKEEYNYLYIYDNTPKYRFIRDSENDYFNFISKEIHKNNNLKVFLHTEFRKISNIKDARFMIKYISKIILFDDINTFICFEKKDNPNISIINYNKEKIKSLDKLFQVIKNDRKQKDVLIKVTSKDIQNNHYRIGFKLYQTGFEEQARNINEIVDENTKLIEELAIINGRIEQEINKLINR